MVRSTARNWAVRRREPLGHFRIARRELPQVPKAIEVLEVQRVKQAAQVALAAQVTLAVGEPLRLIAVLAARGRERGIEPAGACSAPSFRPSRVSSRFASL